jgi:hypothetical protein
LSPDSLSKPSRFDRQRTLAKMIVAEFSGAVVLAPALAGFVLTLPLLNQKHPSNPSVPLHEALRRSELSRKLLIANRL